MYLFVERKCKDHCLGVYWMSESTITNLAKVFSKYGIYSQNRYKVSECPLRVFQTMYLNAGYSHQIETFFSQQPEFNERILETNSYKYNLL